MHDQGIWSAASPLERAFLEATASDEINRLLQWRKEAEWTLLWAVGMVGSLGSPARQCDAVALAIDIMPRLGAHVGPFLSRAALRSDAELRAEAERHEDLWRRAAAARHPASLSLDWNVLCQRRYAFEWLTGTEEWDRVTCDA